MPKSKPVALHPDARLAMTRFLQPVWLLLTASTDSKLREMVEYLGGLLQHYYREAA
jgi:hypothetical protein